jgi:hypothetical protein
MWPFSKEDEEEVKTDCFGDWSRKGGRNDKYQIKERPAAPEPMPAFWPSRNSWAAPAHIDAPSGCDMCEHFGHTTCGGPDCEDRAVLVKKSRESSRPTNRPEEVNLSQRGYDVFKIYVDEPAKPTGGKRETNWLAKCSRSSSGVVRVGQRYFRGQGRNSNGFFILAEAVPQWVGNSKQHAILEALAVHRSSKYSQRK